MNAIPEQKPEEVAIIENLRLSDDGGKRALASFLDTRIEWRLYECVKAAQDSGHDRAEILAASCDLFRSHILTIISLEKHKGAKPILGIIAAMELKRTIDRILEEAQK